MKKVSKVIIPIIAVLVISMICLPVSAKTEVEYDDPNVNELLGVWNSVYNRAVEVSYSGNYRCQIQFLYSNVGTDADDYWITIDFNGENPGYPWNRESLKVEYRWANVGSWTFLTYFDVTTSEDEWDITSATSSVLYLRFTDCIVTSDSIMHTWYFGYEPILTACWT